jgi:hypothetical protein
VRELKLSKQRAEELVQNILPDGMAAELRTRGACRADSLRGSCGPFRGFLRLHQSGRPGRINVSAEFHQRVWESVVAEARGPVGCKSKGLLEMFFIDSVK